MGSTLQAATTGGFGGHPTGTGGDLDRASPLPDSKAAAGAEAPAHSSPLHHIVCVASQNWPLFHSYKELLRPTACQALDVCG